MTQGIIQLQFQHCQPDPIRVLFRLNRDTEQLFIGGLDGFMAGNVEALKVALDGRDIKNLDGDTFEQILRQHYFEHSDDWSVTRRALDLREEEDK